MSQVDPLPEVPPKKVRAWLTYPATPATETRPKIRWTSRGGGKMEFDNVTEKELEALSGFLNGTSYIRCVNGRLHAWSALEPLPEPEDDPIVGPHWRATGDVKQWGGLSDGMGWHSPGLILTAPSAGITDRAWDAVDARRRNVEYIRSCGFVCLRSQRGDDGKYWEQWVLHFLRAARGPLAEHLEQLGPNESWQVQADAAARFMAQHSSCGSLDVTIQRWALSCE